MSRLICSSLCAFLSWSLINCHTSPSICHNTWSWCIQGQIPHELILLWEIKVNAQVLQRAAIDESLLTKYFTINRIFRSITIFRYPIIVYPVILVTSNVRKNSADWHWEKKFSPLYLKMLLKKIRINKVVAKNCIAIVASNLAYSQQVARLSLSSMCVRRKQLFVSSFIAILTVTSPVVINVPTRGSLAVKRKDSFVLWLAKFKY